MSADHQRTELRVPAVVAKLVREDAPTSMKMAAAKGTLPMGAQDLTLTLMIFGRGRDAALRKAAIDTLKGLPAGMLLPVARDRETHPYVLDFMVRHRLHQFELMSATLTNPGIGDDSLLFVAQNARGVILQLVVDNQTRLAQNPQLVEALIENPHTEKSAKYRLGWRDPALEQEIECDTPIEEMTLEQFEDIAEGDFDEGEYDDLDTQSKYQMLMDMPIAEKIKMALTGDKEWRNLLVREPNRMIGAAVMKNPRITEVEVINVVRNRGTSEDLVRIILLNREWMKLYEVKKALVYHPRTPIQRAMRLMDHMNDKDIKMLAKSRDVGQPIVNNARRILANKMQRR